MNIPPKYEDVVAECAALKEELVHMTALRDTWYEQYQELKSSRQQRLTVAEQRAGDLKKLLCDVINEEPTGFAALKVDLANRVHDSLKPDEEKNL